MTFANYQSSNEDIVCSITDQVFTFHCLLDIYLKRKKRNYFAYSLIIKKAFDLVQRDVLWAKLLKCGINGNILNVHIIKDMYEKS